MFPPGLGPPPLTLLRSHAPSSLLPSRIIYFSAVTQSPKFAKALEASARAAMHGPVGNEMREIGRAVDACAAQQRVTHRKLDKLCDIVRRLSPAPTLNVGPGRKGKGKGKGRSQRQRQKK